MISIQRPQINKATASDNEMQPPTQGAGSQRNPLAAGSTPTHADPPARETSPARYVTRANAARTQRREEGGRRGGLGDEADVFYPQIGHIISRLTTYIS